MQTSTLKHQRKAINEHEAQIASLTAQQSALDADKSSVESEIQSLEALKSRLEELNQRRRELARQEAEVTNQLPEVAEALAQQRAERRQAILAELQTTAGQMETARDTAVLKARRSCDEQDVHEAYLLVRQCYALRLFLSEQTGTRLGLRAFSLDPFGPDLQRKVRFLHQQFLTAKTPIPDESWRSLADELQALSN